MWDHRRMTPEDHLLHLALETDWLAAQAIGQYTRSTVNQFIADVGFVHCSQSFSQMERVRLTFFKDITEPLVLLTLSVPLLVANGHQIRYETGNATTDASEVFPHVYGGNISLDTILTARNWPPRFSKR